MTDIDELIAEMTPAEKAGQLTQYFYFRLPAGAEPSRRWTSTPTSSRAMVEAALARGRGRVAAVRHRPGRDQPAAAARRRGQPARHPGAVRLRRHPRAAHDPAGADRDGRVLGPRDHRARARRSPPARPGRSASTGRSRRWSTSPATRAGAGSSRAPARTRTSARRWPRPRSAASRAPSSARPERVIAGPKHFAGYGAALGGRDYDEVNLSDSELWNVYLPPFKAAVDAGAGNIMTAYMDLNGIPATGNRWLFDRGAARAPGASTASWSATPTPCATCVTHGFAADLTDAGARAVNAGVDLEMAIADPAYAHLPEALDAGRGRREAASTRASGGSSRPRSGSACSTTRTSTRTAPARCWPTRPTARSPGSPPSGRPCCCATRATCCRWTPARSARSP